MGRLLLTYLFALYWVQFSLAISSPSSVPSSLPSSCPSQYPSSPPSAEPSVSPTARPSSDPTGSPSSDPSISPSSAPSGMPSSPTSHPSGAPSSLPSVYPSSGPTLEPSGSPSSSPSSLPSSPSAQPSGDPSSMPSNFPSSSPSRSPSSSPSSTPSAPTCVPSSSPSSLPSKIPSAMPSAGPSSPSLAPSGSPSAYPTGVPSSEFLPRNLSCGDCEDFDGKICRMFSHEVVLQCDSSGSPCLYDNLESFIVSNGTKVIVAGACELQVSTFVEIFVESFGSLMASAVRLSSVSISLQGTIDVSGRGTLFGRGAGVSGSGGSYGGSGGMTAATCSEEYFSVYHEEIGSLDVQQEIDENVLTGGFGSGGGSAGGGKGGGVITLEGTVVNITRGKLVAKGSMSNEASIGSGSGGGISIVVTKELHSTESLFDVRGGDADSNMNIAGGSGGRITVKSPREFDESVRALVSGGNDISFATSKCFLGGSGTLLWSHMNSSKLFAPEVLYCDNNNVSSWAVSLITEVAKLNALERFYITSGAAVGIDSMDSSKAFIEVSYGGIVMGMGSFVSSSSSRAVNFELGASSIKILKSSTLRDEGNIRINAVDFELDEESQMMFGCHVRANISNLYNQRGRVEQQSTSVNYCKRLMPDTFQLMGYFVRSAMIIASEIEAMSIVLDGDEVKVIGPSLRVPQVNESSSDGNGTMTCLNNYSIANFQCLIENEGEADDEHQFRMQVLLMSKDNLTLSNGLFVEAPTIEEIGEGVVLSSTGRGCPSNEGMGAGQPPKSTISQRGGGGGGFAGVGGAGSLNNTGGQNYSYFDRYVFSYGSGGGAAGMGSKNSSAGGGLVVLASDGVIDFSGEIFADGADGSNNSGGGAGGMVLIKTANLKGDGFFSVRGGNGGSLGGGGGGGGRLEVDILGESATYDFDGTILLDGGNISSETFFEEGAFYPQAGHGGFIMYPLCPPGRGNNRTTLEFCEECAIDEYSMTLSTEECKECTNKPDASKYVYDPLVQCQYACDPGHQGSDCLTPFEFFVSSIGGEGVFYTLAVSFGCLLIFPLLYLRTKKNIRSKEEYDKQNFKESKYEKNRLFSMFSTDEEIISPNFQRSDDPRLSSRNVGKPTIHELPDASRLEASLDERESDVRRDSIAKNSFPSPTFKLQSTSDVISFHELRLRSRLNDKDLSFHAGRIYLHGVNSPISWLGGAWHWPSTCPYSLLYAINHEKYIHFTRRINKLMEYSEYGWEKCVYLMLLVLLPPHAEQFLMKRRLHRAKLLLQTIATCGNPFFKSSKSSLRVAISPSLTVAYVDILIDSDTYTSATAKESESSPALERRLVGPMGQPKLPVFIRFCGLGTYFSPWYLDTNDLLLQAIPLSHDVSVFIDKAFINFVFDINKILKSLRRHRLKEDLVVLLKNLLDERWIGALGGLVVQFCCLPMSKQLDSIESPSAAPSLSANDVEDPENPMHLSLRREANSHRHENPNFLTELSALPSSHDSTPSSQNDSSVCIGEGQKMTYDAVASNFDKMVDSIQNGLLCPGFLFYHESTPLNEVIPNDLSSIYIAEPFTEAIPERSSISAPGESSGKSRNSDIAIKKQAKDAYGDKAKELERFYNIVRTADKNHMGTDSSESQPQGEESRVVVKSQARGPVEKEFELTSFQARDSYQSSAEIDCDDHSSKGSSAFIYAVTLWVWNQTSKSVKLLDKDYNPRNDSDRLSGPFLPREWVYRSASQRLSRMRLIYETVVVNGNYTYIEMALMLAMWISRKLSYGRNTVTEFRNAKILRRFLTLFLFSLVVMDIILYISFSVIFFCIYDKTGCDDHTGLVVMMLCWPFAIVMAPLSGIWCVLLTPLGQLARRYRCWSSYANISTLTIVSLYLRFFEDAPSVNAYMVTALVVSRIFQHVLIDIYVETQEDKRHSRGWDGLYTSIAHTEHSY